MLYAGMVGIGIALTVRQQSPEAAWLMVKHLRGSVNLLFESQLRVQMRNKF